MAFNLPVGYFDHLPPDHDLGPMLIKVTWTLLGTSAIVVSARLFVKMRTLRKLFLDDYLMILALVVVLQSYTIFGRLTVADPGSRSRRMHHRILQDWTWATSHLYTP